MKCNFCNKEIPDNLKVCPECKSIISNDITVQMEGFSNQNTVFEAPAPDLEKLDRQKISEEKTFLDENLDGSPIFFQANNNLNEDMAIMEEPQQEEPQINEDMTIMEEPQYEEPQINEDMTIMEEPQYEEPQISEDMTIMEEPQQEEPQINEDMTIMEEPQYEEPQINEDMTIMEEPQYEEPQISEDMTIMEEPQYEEPQISEDMTIVDDQGMNTVDDFQPQEEPQISEDMTIVDDQGMNTVDDFQPQEEPQMSENMTIVDDQGMNTVDDFQPQEEPQMSENMTIVDDQPKQEHLMQKEVDEEYTKLDSNIKISNTVERANVNMAGKTQEKFVPSKFDKLEKTSNLSPKKSSSTMIRPNKEKKSKAIQKTINCPPTKSQYTLDRKADGDDFAVGAIIRDTYKILKLFGKGGMGQVFLAEHLRLNKKVVIKTLLKHAFSNPTALKRFKREALLQAKVEHPNAVGIMDLDETPQGTMYIVMNYAKGVPLNELIKAKKLDIKATINIGKQILDILSYAHEQGIIHRDLKPQNIIVEEKNGGYYSKILDFGIAKMIIEGNKEDTSDKAQENLTRPKTILGTLFYMSPEQAVGDSVDYKTDVYSVGVILYQMLSGELPFKSPQTITFISMLLNEKTPAFSQIKPDLKVPKVLEDVVMKSLNKKPEDRPTAKELNEELDKVEKILFAPKTKKSNKGILAIAGAIVLILLIAVPLIFMGGSSKNKELGNKKQNANNTEKNKNKIKVTKKDTTENKKIEKKAPIITAEMIKEKYKDIFANINSNIEQGKLNDADEIMKLSLKSAADKEKAKLSEVTSDINGKIKKQREKAANILKKGKEFQKLEMFEKAQEDYLKAVKLDNSLYESYYGIAEILYFKKDFDNAMKNLKACLKINPKYAKAIDKIGYINLEKGNLDLAKENFEKALELKVSFADSYNGLGLVFAQKGEYEKALNFFIKAEEINPDWLNPKQNMAVILKKMGKNDQAIEVYQKLRKIFPRNQDILYNMGSLYIKTKNYRKALEMFKEYVKLENRSSEANRVAKIKMIIRRLERRFKWRR